MEMSLGEYLDRLSIHLLKVQRIGQECYPEFIHLVQELLLETPTDNFKEVIKTFRKLYDINKEIWNLESELRKGKENEIGLEKVGQIAISVRNWNNKRIAEHNKIIELFGGFKNIKKNHISEDKSKG